MTVDTKELVEKLREGLTEEQRRALVEALLLPEVGAEPVDLTEIARGFLGDGVARQHDTVSPPDGTAVQGGPQLNPDPLMKGTLEDPPPADPPQALDNLDDRARLLALLAASPSGLPGYVLLDQHKIPPQTIELARREGQVGRAERGLGLTHEWGGPWARDTENIDMELVRRYEEQFKERLQLR